MLHKFNCHLSKRQWRNQDDGEGHIGTLVEIGKANSFKNHIKKKHYN